MILTCSACATRYHADPGALGSAGRTVRCAKCGHEWFQAPPADLPRLLDDAPPSESAATDGRAAAPVPVAAPPRSGGWIGPVLLLLAIGLAVAILYFGRERVVAVWPPAEQLYRAVGLSGSPLGAGLELSNVTYVLQTVDGEEVMIIQGDIFNRTEEMKPVPTLRATLLDSANEGLRDWVFRIDRDELQPGETTTFRTMTREPPADYKRLSITFTREPAS